MIILDLTTISENDKYDNINVKYSQIVTIIFLK